MRFLLNSAVLTAFGQWEYRPLTRQQAISWLLADGWQSTIRYPETAEALSLITGIDVPVADASVQMQPGDEALVFRLVFPPGNRRVPQNDKGKLDTDFVLAHSELALLTRES